MHDLSAPHPSAERLAAFRQGQLDDAQRAVIEAHLAGCESCRTLAGPAGAGPGETAALSPSPVAAEVGQALADHPRYRIMEVLGAGGMGAVYKAEHRLMERVVALKVIKKSLTDEPAMVERFRREVKAAAKLSHPNIVTAYDAEQAGDVHFLVMEFVEGTDLARLVKERGALPAGEACDYVRQAALGLEHAHQKGMVHRDVKPHNLMLTPAGQVKILDFGLASLASAAAGSITDLGTLMGTPDYIAPEQARDAHRADARADVYSLGCTFYHLLAGRPPFKGGTPLERVVAHLERTAPPLSAVRTDLPPGLAEVVARMMDKDPARRYQAPGRVAEALAPFCASRDGGGETLAPRPSSRRRWAIAALVLLGLVGLAGAVFGPALVRFFRDRDTGPTPEGLTGGPPFHFKNDRYEATVESDGCLTSLRVGGIEFLDAAVSFSRGAYFFDERINRVLEMPEVSRAGSDVVAARGARASIRYTFGPDALTCDLENRTDHTMQFYAVLNPQVAAVRSDRGRWAKTPAGKDWTDTTWFAGVARLHITGSTRIWGPWEGSSQVWQTSLHAGEIRQVVLRGGRTPEEEAAQVAALLAHREPPEPTRSERPAVVLVPRPAPLEDVRSWTIETRSVRAPVETVAYSGDGQYLASAGSDGAIRLWDPATGRLRRILTGHLDGVHSLAWSPEGGVLASASWDHTVRLWEAETGRLLRVLRGHAGDVQSVTWSPDGKRLASAASDGSVRVWEAASGECRSVFPGDFEGLWAVAWSPDGKTLASGAAAGTVRLREADTGKMVHSWVAAPKEGGRGEQVYYLAWSPDGRTLATGTHDSKVRLWAVPKGQLLRAVEGTAVAWSPDGRTVATGGFTDLVRLWEADSGRLAHALRGHTENILSVAFAPDGKTLASGGIDCAVRQWDAKKGRPGRELPGGVGGANRADWSPDGKTLACGCWNPIQVPFWDLEAGRLRETRPGTYWAVWSPDGKALGSYSPDGVVRLWTATRPPELRGPVRGPSVGTWDLAFAPSLTELATGGDDRTVRLWRSGSGELRAELAGHTGKVDGLAWSPDGRLLASAADDHTTRLWDAGAGRLLRILEGSDGVARGPSLAWSSDGKILAAGSVSGRVSLWDPASGEMLDTTARHSRQVTVAFSPDGKTLLSAGDDGRVRTWDARTGRLERVVVGAGGHGAFSPDRRLVASPWANTFRVWETDTGRLRATFVPLPRGQALLVSADGHFAGLPGVEQHLVYVVETDAGQDLLTPEEFAAKYGWKNDPGRVRLPMPGP